MSKRTSKIYQRIRALKVSIKVIIMSKDQNNDNYLWRITYGYQGLWGVRLVSVRLGQFRLGQVRLHYDKLGQVRLGQVKSGQKVFKIDFSMPNTTGWFNLWHITYGYQGLWAVRLGSVRLVQVRLGWVRIGQVRLSKVRLGQARLSQVKKTKRHGRSILMF